MSISDHPGIVYNQAANATACIPLGSGIQMTTGEGSRAASHWRDEFDMPTDMESGTIVTAPCAHDFQFLRGKETVESGKPIQYEATFYCRMCLEHREVKR